MSALCDGTIDVTERTSLDLHRIDIDRAMEDGAIDDLERDRLTDSPDDWE